MCLQALPMKLILGLVKKCCTLLFLFVCLPHCCCAGSMSSLGSSGGGSLLQVPGALPVISHASLGTGRSSRPMICLSTSQSIDRHSSHRLTPADSVEGYRFSPAHRINRHRLNSAHSIDGYKFSPAHRIHRHRLSSAHSIDGYRLNQEQKTERPKLMYSHSIDRHPSLRLSPTHSAGRRPSHWLSPEDSLDRNKLSPSYVPESSVLKRPASLRSASRQLRRQVCYHHLFLLLSIFSFLFLSSQLLISFNFFTVWKINGISRFVKLADFYHLSQRTPGYDSVTHQGRGKEN